MFQLTLKELREAKGISQAKLAQKLGVSQSTVGMWENGKNKPEHLTLLKLSQFFDVSIDFLVGNIDPSAPPPLGKGVWIPVLGRVQAGVPVEAIEEILDYEEITLEMASHGEHLALSVRGNSMEPRIREGDVVIVHKQPDAETGDTVVVLINGDDATVKKLKKIPDGIMLIPSNPAFEPMYYTNKQIREKPVTILGKVVELRGKF